MIFIIVLYNITYHGQRCKYTPVERYIFRSIDKNELLCNISTDVIEKYYILAFVVISEFVVKTKLNKRSDVVISTVVKCIYCMKFIVICMTNLYTLKIRCKMKLHILQLTHFVLCQILHLEESVLLCFL